MYVLDYPHSWVNSSPWPIETSVPMRMLENLCGPCLFRLQSEFAIGVAVEIPGPRVLFESVERVSGQGLAPVVRALRRS